MILIGWMVSAQAQDLELLAVAKGDVDCSGSIDKVVLYSTEDGDLVVEIAQGVSDPELVRPYSPTSGATVFFHDTDGDRCEELLIFGAEREAHVVRGVDHGNVLRAGAGGEGDSVPDSYVELKPPRHPMHGSMYVGVIEPCTWTEHGCVPNDCYEACEHWGQLEPVPCDIEINGQHYLCPSWGCTHIDPHCI